MDGMVDALWKRGGRTGLVLLLHVALIHTIVTSPPSKRTQRIPASVDVALITPPKPPVTLPPEPPKLVPKPHPAAAPKRVPLLAAKTLTAADENTPVALPERKVMAPEVPKAEPIPTPVPEAPKVRVPAQVDASVSCASPQYPSAARLAGEIGTVRLLFLIATDGQVIESRVEISSGFPRLDEAAREALSLCHFTPGTIDGRPEKSWSRLDYVWRIK